MTRKGGVGPQLERGTQERLVTAAIEVFSEHGYEGARVQEIARRAGLTTGAIYSRFKGKAGLLAAALMARSRSDVRSVSAALDTTVSGGEVFRSLSQRLVTQPLMPRNSLVLDAVAAARRDPELAAVLREYIGELSVRLAALLEKAREEGAMDPTLSVPAVSYYCLSLLFGVVTLKALGVPTPDPEEWDRVMNRILVAMSHHSRPAEGRARTDWSGE